MGLALPALSGGLLPEHTAGDAARLLTVRHAAIAVLLAALAPLVTHQLDSATHEARLRGVSLVLDARLPPEDKLPLAPALLADVHSQDPRGELRDSLDEQRETFGGSERAAFDTLARRADETLVAAVGDAFDEAFLVAGALGVLAALVLVLTGAALPGRGRAAVGLAAASLLAVPAYAALHDSRAPKPVAIADPCAPRRLPGTGGLTGLLQDTALRRLDRAACDTGSSREELVLALADDDEAQRYQEHYGIDPRSVGGLLSILLG
jgi:hypothetical protein